MKRKKLSILGILIFLAFCLCGCQTQILSEEEIISSLPAELTTININGAPINLDVEQFNLLLRKTTDDIDEIHCEVILTDGRYINTVECILIYSYYDTGGWVLDTWDVVSAELASTEGLSQYDADYELSLYYFDAFELQSQTFDSQNQICYSSYNVSYTGTNYSYNGSVTLESFFVDDWFSGYWMHELRYDDAFEWNLAGTWAGGKDEILDYYDNNDVDAFVLYIGKDAISPNNELTFSATAYRSVSSLFSTDKWRARDVENYRTQMYMISDEDYVDPYSEPVWRANFDIEIEGSNYARDYSFEITSNTIELLGDGRLGTLHRGYVIDISISSYGYAIFTKVPA